MDNMKNDYVSLCRFIEKNYKKQYDEILYALELFKGSVKSLQDIMSKPLENENFDATIERANYGKEIERIGKTVEGYLAVFSPQQIKSVNSGSSSTFNISDQIKKKYPHFVDEDFTYKRISGFYFEGNEYRADTWKELLVNVSQLLYRKNPTLFNDTVFSEGRKYKGRQYDYFSKKRSNAYYDIIPGTGIYVLTNRSANDLCKLTGQLLDDIIGSKNGLRISVDEDLDSQKYINLSYDNSVKTADFVRNQMRMLSDKNYTFSHDMLNKLLDINASKRMFGIGFAFFRERISPDFPLYRQIKDSKGNNRYWNEIFTFNNRQFLIASQWTNYSVDRFCEWFNSLERR